MSSLPPCQTPNNLISQRMCSFILYRYCCEIQCTHVHFEKQNKSMYNRENAQVMPWIKRNKLCQNDGYADELCKLRKTKMKMDYDHM